MHAIITVDHTVRSFEGDVPGDNGANQKTISSSLSAQKTSSQNKTLDVLVLYTSAAEAAVGSIYSTASSAVDQAAGAYTNSDISSSQLNISLVGTERLDFQESSNIASDVSSLASNSEANSLREEYFADVVVLLTDGDYGTIIGRVDAIGPSDHDAYAIVQAEAATQHYTFAHEVGHLQGLEHNDAYEFDINEITYNTIMYLNTTHITTQHFSNPNVTYKSFPTGTAAKNAAQILRNTASTMADFREEIRALTAVITGGATAACSGDPLGFNASVSGGTGSYAYRWDTGYNGISYTYAGSGSSYVTSMPPGLDLYVKLTVTSGEESEIDFKYLENIDDSPYCSPYNAHLISGSIGDQDLLPTTVVLRDAYPNPFNPSTVIPYGLPEDTDVTLVVYDMLGREVARLVHGYQKAGNHRITFDASHLPNGVFLYQLQTDSFRASKLITLLK